MYVNIIIKHLLMSLLKEQCNSAITAFIKLSSSLVCCCLKAKRRVVQTVLCFNFPTSLIRLFRLFRLIRKYKSLCFDHISFLRFAIKIIFLNKYVKIPYIHIYQCTNLFSIRTFEPTKWQVKSIFVLWFL